MTINIQNKDRPNLKICFKISHREGAVRYHNSKHNFILIKNIMVSNRINIQNMICHSVLNGLFSNRKIKKILKILII